MRPKEQEHYQTLCLQLQSQLAVAMQMAMVNLNDQHTTYAISSTQALLNPDSNSFKHKIVEYIRGYLVNEFKTTAEFEEILSPDYPKQNDDSEIANLFKSPKQAMGKDYDHLNHFGLSIGGTDGISEFYNFDEQLKLIFKINFLYSACLHTDFEADWIKNQYEILQSEVDKFALATTKDKDQLKPFLKLPPPVLPTSQIQQTEQIEPIEQAEPVEQEVLEQIARLEQGEYPESIEPIAPTVSRAKKAANILLGKATIDFFEACYKGMKKSAVSMINIATNHYHTGYSIRYSVLLHSMFYKFLKTTLVDVPIVIAKSILGLPIRLVQAIVDLATKENSSARRRATSFLSGVNKFINNLIDITLRLGLWIMAAGASFFTALAAAWIIYPIVMIVPSLIIKPIISKFTKSSPPLPWSSLIFKLYDGAQRTCLANPDHNNLLIKNKVITLTAMQKEAQSSRQQSSQQNGIATSFDWLKTMTAKRASFRLKFQNASHTSSLYHVMIGSDKHKTNKLLNRIIEKSTMESLTLDWRFYNQTKRPAAKELDQIATRLETRKKPLKKLTFATNVMNDKAIERISKALMNNKHLQLETLSIPTNQLSLKELKSLLQLVNDNKSIKNIPTITNDKNPKKPEQQKIRQKIHAILAERRGEVSTKDKELPTAPPQTSPSVSRFSLLNTRRQNRHATQPLVRAQRTQFRH